MADDSARPWASLLVFDDSVDATELGEAVAHTTQVSFTGKLNDNLPAFKATAGQSVVLGCYAGLDDRTLHVSTALNACCSEAINPLQIGTPELLALAMVGDPKSDTYQCLVGVPVFTGEERDYCRDLVANARIELEERGLMGPTFLAAFCVPGWIIFAESWRDAMQRDRFAKTALHKVISAAGLNAAAIPPPVLLSNVHLWLGQTSDYTYVA